MDGRRDDDRSLPFASAGALIREARLRRGLTLDVLFQETRIPVHVLEAIEQDDFDRIQPALYARSFLRTVATALDLDPAEVLRLYEEGTRGAAAPAPATWEAETRVEKVSLLGPVWRRRLPWLLGGIVVLVAVLLLLSGRRSRPEAGAASRAAGEEVAGPGTDTVATRPSVPPAGTEGEPGGSVGGETAVVPTRPATVAPADTAAAGTSTVPPAVQVLDTLEVGHLLARPDSTALAAARSLPAGTSDLVFADGQRYRWVLRLLMDRRVDVAVATSPTGRPEPADWSRIDVPGVPHDGIVPGRVYAAGGRYVMYWGARDCFLVRLGAADGVTLTLNGDPRPIPRRNVGRDWMLCAPVPATGR